MISGHVPVGLFENSLVPGETYLLDHFAARKLCFPGKAGLGSQPALNRMESYSRKVFVGGLPPDIDEGPISGLLYTTYFHIFKCARKFINYYLFSTQV